MLRKRNVQPDLASESRAWFTVIRCLEPVKLQIRSVPMVPDRRMRFLSLIHLLRRAERACGCRGPFPNIYGFPFIVSCFFRTKPFPDCVFIEVSEPEVLILRGCGKWR